MPEGIVILNSGTGVALSSFYSQIAQSVEQMTVNHWVGGSSPSLGAKLNGRVGEWFMPAVLKTAEPQGSVSSNLTSSAKFPVLVTMISQLKAVIV